MINSKRITLKEIAKRADTSTMAVSVVLNGARSTTGVADATRSRILSVAADLNYIPNAMARGLRSRSSKTLGVLYGWAGGNAVHDAFSTDILDGIVSGAAATGYHVLIHTEPWKSKAVSASAFAGQRTDGVVVVAPDDNSDIISGLTELGLPLTVLASVTTVSGVPYVTLDNREGMRLALEHLWEKGHRRIAYIGHGLMRYGPRERDEAYREWMAARGLPTPHADRLFDVAPFGEELPIEWLLTQATPRPTAIVAFNDGVACKVLTVARRLGISLPEELSVVGWDDTMVASLTFPLLTTVRHPLRDMGRDAVTLLVARIKGSDKENFVPAHIITPRLIVRDSTAPPASLREK